MKKLFLLCFLSFSFWSCSLDDDSYNFHYEFIPIESVSMPDSFTYGEIHTISYSYFNQSTCHVFHDLYYMAEDSTRTVAVINQVFENSNCEPVDDNLIERSFNFKPMEYGSYIFKFWTGVNENDEDEFLIYEILVEE